MRGVRDPHPGNPISARRLAKRSRPSWSSTFPITTSSSALTSGRRGGPALPLDASEGSASVGELRANHAGQRKREGTAAAPPSLGISFRTPAVGSRTPSSDARKCGTGFPPTPPCSGPPPRPGGPTEVFVCKPHSPDNAALPPEATLCPRLPGVRPEGTKGRRGGQRTSLRAALRSAFLGGRRLCPSRAFPGTPPPPASPGSAQVPRAKASAPEKSVRVWQPSDGGRGGTRSPLAALGRRARKEAAKDAGRGGARSRSPPPPSPVRVTSPGRGRSAAPGKDQKPPPPPPRPPLPAGVCAWLSLRRSPDPPAAAAAVRACLPACLPAGQHPLRWRRPRSGISFLPGFPKESSCQPASKPASSQMSFPRRGGGPRWALS